MSLGTWRFKSSPAHEQSEKREANKLLCLREVLKTAAMCDEQGVRSTARGGLRKIFRKKYLFVDKSSPAHEQSEKREANKLLCLREVLKTAAMCDEQGVRSTARGGLRKIFRKKYLFVDKSSPAHTSTELTFRYERGLIFLANIGGAPWRKNIVLPRTGTKLNS